MWVGGGQTHPAPAKDGLLPCLPFLSAALLPFYPLKAKPSDFFFFNSLCYLYYLHLFSFPFVSSHSIRFVLMCVF